MDVENTYTSCHILKHGLCFFANAVASCCLSPIDRIDEQSPPILFENYEGEVFSKQELLSQIDYYNTLFKNGNFPVPCRNCVHIEEKEWDEENYIDYITITNFSKCNADCIYCSNGEEMISRTNETYEILPILKHLKNIELIRKGCEIHIGGGEFTIYEECNAILELFAVNDFARVFVPTNAIKYSQLLFEAMDKATTYIIVSLDSGSKNLYKKIKRVDAFNQVIQNLKKYAATEKSRDAIRLKYIIIPTVNDNIFEFKKFLNIAKNIGVQNIIIDIDARYSRFANYSIDDYYIYLAQVMNEIALKMNFKTEFYSFLCQCKKDTNEHKFSFTEYLYKYIKFRYFSPELKELYESHQYFINSRI